MLRITKVQTKSTMILHHAMPCGNVANPFSDARLRFLDFSCHTSCPVAIHSPCYGGHTLNGHQSVGLVIVADRARLVGCSHAISGIHSFEQRWAVGIEL